MSLSSPACPFAKAFRDKKPAVANEQPCSLFQVMSGAEVSPCRSGGGGLQGPLGLGDVTHPAARPSRTCPLRLPFPAACWPLRLVREQRQRLRLCRSR